MTFYHDDHVVIFFGDAEISFPREFLMGPVNQEELLRQEKLVALKNEMALESLFLVRQMHTAVGVVVSDESFVELGTSKPEGDFLVTQCALTGLGVYTADCLPLVFHDTYNQAIGICHAGWVGSLKKVALETLECMRKEYGTRNDDLRIFFGPSARVCCYEVQEPFIEHVRPFSFFEKVFTRRNEKLFFDMPLFNQLLLEEAGIPTDSFVHVYNVCTIESEQYCSNRRNGASTQRQLTIIALR